MTAEHRRCVIRFQTLPYSCGPASVVNALLAVGVKIGGRQAAERQVRTAACCDESGTGHTGVIAALRAYGLSVHEFEDKSRSRAWTWLHGSLNCGRPVILATDKWQHWVTACGTLGDRVVVVDATNSTWNVRENGTHLMPRLSLLRRWRGAGEGMYYGISAGRG